MGDDDTRGEPEAGQEAEAAEAAKTTPRALEPGRIGIAAVLMVAIAGLTGWALVDPLRVTVAGPDPLVGLAGYLALIAVAGYFGGAAVVAYLWPGTSRAEGALAATIAIAVNLWFATSSEGVAPTAQRMQAAMIAVSLAYGLAVGGVVFGRRLRDEPLAAIGMASYAMIGVVLVLGFAWSLRSAVATQIASPCRSLQPEPREGPALDFAVEDLDGNPVRLSDFAGKFVVLNFWATWCEPCITEWPQVARLAERLADDDDIVVIALSIDSDKSKIRPFLDQMSLGETDVVVLWDPNQDTHTQYGTEKIPDTYFIDEDGQLLHAFINVREWGSPEAVRCIGSVVGR